MFKRILLTLDGSPLAVAALPAAVTLARMSGGELRLLTALEVPPVFAYPEFRSEHRISAESYLLEIANDVAREWGGSVTTVVREGRIHDEILGEAEDWGTDMIVMSTHGRGGLSRVWLGSVSDRCVRKSERPVLLIRPPASGAFNPATSLAVARVVLPLDGSELAEAALPHAVTLANQLDAPFTLVLAVTYLGSPEYPWVSLTVGLKQRLLEKEKNEASRYLNGLMDRLRAEGAASTAQVATNPQPAQAILDEAGADLIVMTPRGRGVLDRAIVGSVADKVVRGAEGPVLIVPPEARRAPASAGPGSSA